MRVHGFQSTSRAQDKACTAGNLDMYKCTNNGDTESSGAGSSAQPTAKPTTKSE